MPTRKVFGLDGVLLELAQLQAAMRGVRVNGPPDGAVAALVEATKKYIEWLYQPNGESKLDGILLARLVDDALARFEVGPRGE